MLLGYMKLKIKKYLLYTKLNLYLIIINSNNAPNPSVSSQVKPVGYFLLKR